MTTRILELKTKVTGEARDLQNISRAVQDLTKEIQQSQAQFRQSGQAARGLASDLKLLSAEEAKAAKETARVAVELERRATQQARTAAVIESSEERIKIAREKAAVAAGVTAAKGEEAVNQARQRTRATTARAEKDEVNLEKARQQARAATARAEAAEERLAKQRERSKNAATGLQKSLFSLKQAYVAYTLAAAGAIKAAKEIYAALKEGAAIRTAANQFDILTAKINTTSDALLNRMRVATKGFVSDAQLISSANDIISLGLAKNEQDVAQLATVIAGLGLDMQQVILTFSNNSKARLDSLGLSVEGVTKRMKELQAQGFQGDAFDAAVLQLLTERYNEMAGAIDNVEAATRRAEAAFANLVDTGKSGFAQLVGSVLVAVEDEKAGVEAIKESFRQGRISAFEYFVLLAEQSFFTIGLSQSSQELIDALDDQEVAFDRAQATTTAYYIALGKAAEAEQKFRARVPFETEFKQPFTAINNEAIEEGLRRFQEAEEEKAKIAQEQAQKSADAFSQINNDAITRGLYTFEQAEKEKERIAQEAAAAIVAASGAAFDAAIKAGDEALVSFAETAIYAGGRTSDQSKNLQELQKEYDKTVKNIRSLEGGTASVGVEQDKLNEKLEKQREHLAEVTAAIEPLKNIHATIVSSTGEFVVNQDAVNAALYESIKAAGGGAEALAAYGLASGQLSEAQAEAALKTAALQAKIKELGEAIVSGEVSPREAVAQIQGFIREIESTDFTAEAGINVKPVFNAETTEFDRAMEDFFSKVNAGRERAKGPGGGVPEGAGNVAAAIVFGVDAATSPALTKIEEVATAATEAAKNPYPVQIDAYTDEASGKISELQSQVSALTDKTHKIKFEFETSGSPPNIPGRAKGGPVYGGSPYVVGERGPELFIPRTSGNIVPNNQMNNRINLTVNVQGGGDAAQIAGGVKDELLAAFEALGVPVS